ncbi:stress up-regulated Nod 19 protein, partial [Trifolium medium]|nr:stress up-regulated Nod 19 protein [Trifolium medium]
EGNGCVHVKRTSLPLPGGYVIYAVAHQHSGGIGATLYGQTIVKFRYHFLEA